ncbi:MAG: hypothetical protein RI894_821 [Bacteroidota bacterium]|jgi:ribosomal protein S18 acetylase RimI-like enzyme
MVGAQNLYNFFMEHLIRLATPNDAEALSAVMRQTFWDTYHTFNTLSDMTSYMKKSYSIAQQTAEINDVSIANIILENGGEIVAFAQILEKPADKPQIIPLNSAMLARFYLTEALKGKGFAAELLEACLAETAKRGYNYLWLTVWQNNPRAIRFYEKQGFETIGTTVFTLGSDEQTDWLMLKKTQ